MLKPSVIIIILKKYRISKKGKNISHITENLFVDLDGNYNKIIIIFVIFVNYKFFFMRISIFSYYDDYMKTI